MLPPTPPPPFSSSSSCTAAQKSGEVSISDDPKKQVFTVTINKLRSGDSGYYWCGVEGVRVNQLGNFHTVPAGVSTVSRATVQSGGSVTIPCSYDNIYKQQVKYWCNGSDWSSCTLIVRTNSSKKSGEVSISDDPKKQVFTVTINKLRSGDSGYYWCGVEIGRGSAVGTPVSLSVTEGGRIIEKQSLFLYVGLGLLVLLLIIIIIAWKVCDKHKKKMAMNQNPGSTELTLNPDHEYANIDRTGIIKGDPAKQAFVEPGADVTYSSILLPDPQQVSSRCSSHRPAVTPASDVVYSSVTQQDRE
ncbi:CMRF35-like molecule 1 [Paramormyrops kingsleyae]|uniref:CMRF35-like molecule 1 n=1 Tax=Paramormyrops kingsleyae TaxID=1676925 RepID=UPI003B96DFA9